MQQMSHPGRWFHSSGNGAGTAPAPLPAPLPVREQIARFMLACWGVVTLIGFAFLSVQHMKPLRLPTDQAGFASAMLKLRQGSKPTFLVHVIYVECSCAKALFDHLIARHPFRDTEEAILFVGKDPGKQTIAESAGFTFTTISADELLSRFGLEAAPVLVILNSAGRLRYAGGYYSEASAIVPLDAKIQARLASGLDVPPFPIFGCAVSPTVKERVTQP